MFAVAHVSCSVARPLGVLLSVESESTIDLRTRVTHMPRHCTAPIVFQMCNER